MYSNCLFKLRRGSALLFCIATLGQGFAGTFSTGFNSGPPARGMTFGNAAIDRTGGVEESGVLRLTESKADQEGAFVINDLDPDKAVSGFIATFKVRIGGGNGGEGFSFNLAPDIPDGTFSEEGVGLGLSVSFDTFDVRGVEAPSIDVKFRGVLVASARFNPRTGDGFVDVSIRVDEDGTIDVDYGTTRVHGDLFAFTPVSGRFGFGARTSDRTDAHLIDDLSITTTILSRPFVKSATPSGVEVRPDLPIVVEIQDFDAGIDQESIKLLLNGDSVSPVVSRSRSVTRIEYQPTELFASGSRNSVRLEYLETGASAREGSVDFAFLVESFATIPAGYALPAGTVNTTQPGFKIRTVQARVDAGSAPTLNRAEAQLAGNLIDPLTQAPFLNEAVPGPNEDGTYDEIGVINFEKDGNPGGSFLESEKLIPGIPGSGGHTVNAAMEILTFLELPAGFHKFGVSSDDGFRVSVGARDARDFFSLPLGQFDGARSVADSSFSFLVDSAGVYSFRIIWFQSGGGGSIEFYSFREDGTRVLVNNRQDASAIKAYRSLQAGVRTPPIVASVAPPPNAVGLSLSPEVRISIRDGDSKVVPSTIALMFDGKAVVAVVNGNSGITSVSFQPAAELLPSTRHTLALGFSDDASPPRQFSNEWEFETARESVVTGQWDFDGGDLAATFGLPMEYGDRTGGADEALTEFGSTAEFGIPDIGGEIARVMKYNRAEPPEGEETVAGNQPGYLVHHSVQPNGGGSKVNEWTLLMDVLFPDPQVNPFSSLIQIDGIDTDGDLFVRWNEIGGEGTGGIGLSGQFSGNPQASLRIGQWHRIAIGVDTASSAPKISAYVDGVLFQELALTAPQVDGRHALSPTFRLFADDNNELNTFYVNSIQVLDGKLTEEKIAELGVATAEGLPAPFVPGNAPALGVVLDGTTLTLSWPLEYPGYVLESAEDLSNSQWVPVEGGTANSVSIESGPDNRFFRLRKTE